MTAGALGAAVVTVAAVVGVVDGGVDAAFGVAPPDPHAASVNVPAVINVANCHRILMLPSTSLDPSPSTTGGGRRGIPSAVDFRDDVVGVTIDVVDLLL